MKNSSSLIDSWNNRFWASAVKSSYLNVESLSAFRIIVGLFILFIYHPTFSWITVVPDVLFNPPVFSTAFLFSGFPGIAFFAVIDFIRVASSICLTLGVKSRISGIIYVLASVLALNFQYSFGKIDHNILIYAMIACMSFSGWGSKLAIVPDKEASTQLRAKTLSLYALLVCFAFFTAGYLKGLNWVNLDTTKAGTANWFYNGFFDLHRNKFLAPYFLNLPFVLFKVMDCIAVAFEVTGVIFLVYSRKAWKLWLVTAALFHVVNMLMLNISFLPNVMVYSVFINYSGLYRKIAGVFNNNRTVTIVVSAVFVLITLIGYNVFTSSASIRFTPAFKLLGEYSFATLILFPVVAILLLTDVFNKTEGQFNEDITSTL